MCERLMARAIPRQACTYKIEDKNKHITVNFKNQFSDMLIYFELGFMSQAHQAQSATSLFLSYMF